LSRKIQKQKPKQQQQQQQTFNYFVLNSTTADRSLQFSRNENPGRVSIRDLASLEAFTIGFWMKTDDKLNKGTPFSYGTSEQSNELLLYNYQEFHLIIHGESR